MRLKPKIWYLVSLLFFVAAILMWRYANQYGAQHHPAPAQTISTKPQHPLVNVVATNSTKIVAKRKSYRLSNTHQTIAQLMHNRHALILRNALIDTEIPVALDIPAHLRAKGAPGSYLVQADRPLDKDFYDELNKAGAAYVSYVPNDAALVKATPEVATNLASQADIIAVLPYEPYYKLDSTLLPSAVEQETQSNMLSVVTFPGQRDAALAALTQLGAKLVGEDSSPFGPTLVVKVPDDQLVAVAQLPLAQEVEVYTPRQVMNDLTRVIMNVATNTLTNTPNYLNLSGKNVTVNVNDTGIDATHPDFASSTRITADFPGALTDSDGHGTHVAGIIAGNGSESGTVSNPPPGSVKGADFRGKATNASLFVQGIDIYYGPFISDSFLEKNASTNLGPTNLISNNSWGYSSQIYDIHAASFDAATRDAQPNVSGEQPLLFVFAAGNSGYGGDNGTSGESGSINSPGTAKNVITVGASDSPRFITNEVYEDTDSNDISQVFYGETSSSNLVTWFSSCGNVGAGTEGLYGRFKPDVVAPGAFIVSCRSSNYIDPSNETFVTTFPFLGQVVDPGKTNTDESGYEVPIPNDTSGVFVLISSNATSPIPFPTNMILLADPFYPPTDVVSSNDSFTLTNYNAGDTWFFGITPPTNQPGPVSYDLNITLYETNSEGDYFVVLSNLNNGLKPYYRYETGTSMSAAAVSGTLALMQEFLASGMGITNPSPAVLKAMLINGSRTLGPQYDFNVSPAVGNEQGWGLPNLSNSVPASLTNANPSMVVIDQSTNRALATGQYQTYKIACLDTNASNFFPLRISLVWTDPPGDPAAGIELVNNLEMTVVDNSGTNIYLANNFNAGDIFTEASPTNLPTGSNDNDVENVYVDNTGVAHFTTAGDSINNVQNIYITPANGPIQFPLTVTISGTRINVNAVTTQTNNILQDYALVISSDDPKLTSPLTITTNAIASTNAPLITLASNGVPLLHQRVGANEPDLYSFQLGDTNGNQDQWHFFIFSNTFVLTSNLTNVAFATFLPPNLSIPRASGTADIDLYVLPASTEIPNFTNYIADPANLDTFAENAIKSVGRTGTESVIFTNATYPVYYIGVKSEDQQASDFGFYSVAQSNSFSSASADGNTITAPGTMLPVAIPDATSPTPALGFAFMVDPNPALTLIRRATVTLGIQFPPANDLTGQIQFDGLTTVLHTYSSSGNNGFTNTFDDLQEDPNANDDTSVGPGSLAQYVGLQANGLWLLTEQSAAIGESGYLTQFTVSVDLQQPQTVGFLVTIPGQSWFDDYIDVPNDATNMTIYTLYESSTGGPVGIYETNEIGQILTTDYGTTNLINAPGGSLSLGTNNPVPGWPGAPPLAGGYWYYGIYNYSTDPVTLFVQVQIQESLTPNLVQSYTNTDFIPLTTDGHTQSQICVNNGQQLVDLQVGLRLDDTNLDDLVIHLTSPQGTSVLLFEDRGGTNATNLGMSLITSNIVGTPTNGSTNYVTNYFTNFVYTVFTEDTNLASTPIKFAPPPYATNIIVSNVTLFSNSFETVTNGVYTNGAVLEGWLVTNNYTPIMTTNGFGVLTNYEVGVVTDSNGDILTGTNSLGTNYLALTSGRILQTFGVNTNSTNAVVIPITNGMPYELVFYARPLGIVDWWPGNGNAYDVIGTNNGVISNLVVTNFFTNGPVVTSNIVVTPLLNYGVGEVSQAFKFDGMGTTPTNEVDFGTNTGNFGTNDFSVEFWIQEPSGPPVTYGIMEKRTACDYNTNMWTITSLNGLLSFEISGDTNLYDTVLTPTNAIDDGQFHHAAITRQGGLLSLYIDGLLATNYATNVVNITNTNMFRAGQTMCVGSGVEPFVGELDELSLYDRALSPAEVFAIYHAGSVGKVTTNSLLPNFQLTLDNIATNTIIFTNAAAGWQLFTNSFIATNDSVTVEFAGNPMGILLDDIQLIQLPATNYNNYYLPEEPISPFVGENPLGCWTLDVWDTRTDSPLPTNGSLLSWTLQMTTSSTNATLYVLTNGEPNTVTNLTSNSIAYFAVDVPFYATFATNILTANSGGPLTLFFNQNALPTGGLPGDVTLQTGVTTANSPTTNTLATLGNLPPLLPGRRYFLGVENNGTLPAAFTIQVDFNGGTNLIIPLTNQMPYTNIVGTNILGTNDPEYYSFTVPTNAVLVTFQILGATNGEVDLYARQGLPVPSPLLYDYESANSGSNDQFIAVTTNSIPISLQPVDSTNLLVTPEPTTWYLAAYNPAGVSNIQYTILATFMTNGQMQYINLTNAIAYTNTATPGYPTNLLYTFVVTNSPSGIIFTVTNLTNAGNVQLLADLDNFPTPNESYAGSFNLGTNSQYIEVLPNANLPSLNGTWYLAVPNTWQSNVTYSIEASTNVGPPNVGITWSGFYNNLWDILTTSNWVVTTNTTLRYVFQNGANVTFDDSAIGSTTVDLTAALAPASITVNNSAKVYSFVGTGGIVSGPLTMTGPSLGQPSLTIDNTGANSFSSISLGDAQLQIGNNDTAGSIGPSATVDTGSAGDGILTFDRTDDIFVPNVISDAGSVEQNGTGIVVLAGTNTYGGTTTVNSGTIIVANTNALGSGTGLGSPVTVNASGGLDLGGLPVAYPASSPLFDGKVFYIAGVGPTGNGAIVNNGGNDELGGLENIILNEDASIGGFSRWDIRFPGGFADLKLGNDTLTKVGPNQIDIYNATVSDGSIVIDEGILSFEGTNDVFGINDITVNSGGLFGQISDPSGTLLGPITLNGGGITNMSGSGDTFLDGPIDLQNNSFIGNGGGYDYFDQAISGSGSLTNLGMGTNLFAATNNYTGATYVVQGTLGFTNGGCITNSVNINVSPGAVLDSTENTTLGQVLTLGTNQTLIANGTVLGAAVFAASNTTVYGSGVINSNLFMSTSSILSPGPDGFTIGTLTVEGIANLVGTNIMKINKSLAPQPTNDLLVAGMFSGNGILIVTNYGPTNFASGDSFTLFASTNTMHLSFSTIVLPPLTNGLYWGNNFATGGGTIFVTTNSSGAPSAAQLSVSLSGSSLVFSGTNGTPGGQYELLTSTNLSLPFSNWTVVSTNYFDSNGDFSLTNPAPGTNTASEYYLLQSP